MRVVLLQSAIQNPKSRIQNRVSALRRSSLGHGHGQAIGARMRGSAPWKTEETIVGLPRLLVLSVFSRFGGCHLSASSRGERGLSPFRRRIRRIRTGSRTRPSDWGSIARFGPVEDRRNNRRLATFTRALCVLQIWWLSPFSTRLSPFRPDAAKVEKHIEPLGQRGAKLLAQKSSIFGVDTDRTDLVDDSDCLHGLACPSAVLDRLFKWPPA